MNCLSHRIAEIWFEINTYYADLGQNANDKTPTPETPIQKMLSQNPNPQTQKSVAFHTLAFCPWHYDRIPQILTNN